MNLFSKIFGVLFLFLISLGIPKIVFAVDPLGSWSSTASLPYLLASHGSFSHANKISIVGGSAVTGQSKFDVLTAIPSASGTISGWTTTSLMPTALIFHSVAKKDNYVYVVGGKEENPGSALDYVNKVFLGLLNSDGTASSWQLLTNGLPQKRGLGAAVMVGDRIYYAGGRLNDAITKSEVYVADINQNGTLQPWPSTPVGYLPVPMAGFGMISYQDKIVVFGGRTNSGNSSQTYAATVNSTDGSLSAWVTLDDLPQPLAMSGFTLVGDTIVTAGGETPSITNKIYYAKFDADGNLGEWQESANVLPGAVGARPTLVYINGYLYLAGGYDTNYSNKVYYAKFERDTNLNVPLLKQTDPLWGGYLYDSADEWAPPEPDDIARWGCALTSAAMVFQYHGFEKLPDGVIDLNPGTLNTWLKGQSDGYIRNGLVNWLALARLSKLAAGMNPGFAYDALEYNRNGGSNTAQLTDDLENGIPGILEEPGHFIVGKGIVESSFSINDPFYDRTSLSDYSDTFLSLGRFKPSDTDLSYIMLVVDQGLDISVSSPSGVLVGESFIQDPIDNDEGDGSSGNPLKIFYLPVPENGAYSVELSSQSIKNYKLESYFYDLDGNVKIATSSGIVGPNDSDIYSTQFNKEDSSNSSSNENITFDSFIADINSLYGLGEINFPNRVLLLAQAKVAKRLAGNNLTKKVSVKILKAMRKAIIKQKGRGVSENAYNILNADIQSLLVFLSP